MKNVKKYKKHDFFGFFGGLKFFSYLCSEKQNQQ